MVGCAAWKIGAEEATMEGMLSVWDRQEGVEELKARLLLITAELESFRTNAQEEIRRNQESISNLLHLLNITSQERDEARRQLQSLANKIAPGGPVELRSLVSHLQPQSQEFRPIGANSDIEKSDSHYSLHVYPCTETLSSEMSQLIMLHSSINAQLRQQPILSEHHNSNSMGISPGTTKFDKASAVIDSLVSNRALPEKGKLLQTVMEAGPLLQTLLVAGPLPQWRNPPPLKPIQIPSVAAEGGSTETANQSPGFDPSCITRSSPDGSVPCKRSPVGSETGAADSCFKQAMLTCHGSSYAYQSLTKKLRSM